MKTLITLLIPLLLVACAKEGDAYSYAQSSFLRLCESKTIATKVDASTDNMTFSATCQKAK